MKQNLISTSRTRFLMGALIVLTPLGAARATDLYDSLKAFNAPPAQTPQSARAAPSDENSIAETRYGAQGPVRSDGTERRDDRQREHSMAQNRGYEGFLQWQEMRSNSP